MTKEEIRRETERHEEWMWGGNAFWDKRIGPGAKVQKRRHSLLPGCNHGRKLGCSQGEQGVHGRQTQKGLNAILRNPEVTQKATRNQQENGFLKPLWWEADKRTELGGPKAGGAHGQLSSFPQKKQPDQGTPRPPGGFPKMCTPRAMT